MTLTITDLPSPNCDSREGAEVSLLVLHYTGMKTGADALDKLTRPESKVSAHYLVEEDGRVFRMVDETMRAWHAGVSSWRGDRNINQLSIGIEIVNPGHEWGYRPFPSAQMQSVIALCKAILSRHKIPARNVVGHSDVAPSRKEDPGELFDWPSLAQAGIGLWPSKALGMRHEGSEKNNPQSLIPNTQSLALYGYDTQDLKKATIAFQRHFRPKNISGQWDSECQMLLDALLAMV